jgi:hypothetical protein
VVILSLNESVSILEAWISFIDDYVKGLTLAKFNHTKAFHVTTMLARRLIVTIFEPRNGVLKTFKAGGMGQITKAMFWSTLRSLDVALEIKKIGMANHPLVSAELVKFLTVNSGVEAIEQLQTRVEVLEAQLTESNKLAKAADKSATTACNKTDLVQTAHALLMKWVSKLE